MRSRKGSMLIGALAACFIAVITISCVACLIRNSEMFVCTSCEKLEIERAKHDALSILSSGCLPDPINYKNVNVTFEGSSEDKNIILIIQKEGFLKVRESCVVWPNEGS
ncbi:MAG: hypothetical protein GX672_02640 [Synergistaceae bacterium]|nr:hypothetical protein [Synergistaceae bacterium]